MTLQDLAYVSDIVSGVAVIISLFYLAISVRANSRHLKENTQSLRATNEITSNDFNAAYNYFLLEHPKLLDVLIRGNQGERLEPEDYVSYSVLMNTICEAHQTYFVQHARGLAGDEIWNYFSREWDAIFQERGAVAWWTKSRSRYIPAYREYIDRNPWVAPVSV